jgi:hypothetical protein
LDDRLGNGTLNDRFSDGMVSGWKADAAFSASVAAVCPDPAAGR